jgi:hypothetical protein
MMSYQIAQEQLAWARETYQDTKAWTDQALELSLEQHALDREMAQKLDQRAGEQLDIQRKQLGFQEEAMGYAREDRQRYKDVFQPIEDSLIEDAESYSSKARQELEAGRAAGSVAQQYAAARRASLDELESFGIDPAQTRYAALDLGARLNQAQAAAGAENQARINVEDKGRAMRAAVVDIGRGYPAQAAQAFGMGTGAAGAGAAAAGAAQGFGQTGLGYAQAGMNGVLQAGQLNNQTFATGSNATGNPAQWQGQGTQALGVWGNALTQGYQNQMAYYNAKKSQSSGIGGILGTGLGFATMFLEDGGAVDPEMMPQGAPQGPPQGAVPTSMNHEGIHVRATMSPSGGQATDDVPARLNVGEFVLPKDVVAWYGEEKLQKLVQAARKGKEQAPAKPEVRSATPGVLPTRR